MAWLVDQRLGRKQGGVGKRHLDEHVRVEGLKTKGGEISATKKQWSYISVKLLRFRSESKRQGVYGES